MHFISIPVHNLFNRPLRSGLTLLGIAVAVGSCIALVGASRGVQSAWTRSFNERDTHIIALRKSAVDLLSATVEESIGNGIRQIPGVQEVSGELADLVEIEPGQSLLAVGWDPRGYLWTTASVHEGKMPDLNQPMGVVLGELAAASLRKKIGDAVLIEGSDFVVTGIVRYQGSLNNSILVMQLPMLQKLMGLPGKVTGFSIRSSYPGDTKHMGELKGRLNAAFPLLAFAETGDVANSVRSMRFLRSMAWAVSIISFFMGTVVVLNTQLMSVMERAYDIGVLCAIGWQPILILSMILIEGILITAAGSALGIGLGAGVLKILARMPPVLGFLEPEINLRLVLEVAAAALAMGVAGSLYPAVRAVCLNPVDALRRE
jgi:putative ABC transport system permease protein